MPLPRRRWLAAGSAALVLLLGGLAVNRLPQQAAGQSSPHGTLPIGTVPPQIRQAYPPPSDAQPPTPDHGHDPHDLTPIAKRGGPGSDGKPEHNAGHGLGAGPDTGTGAGHDAASPDGSPSTQP